MVTVDQLLDHLQALRRQAPHPGGAVVVGGDKAIAEPGGEHVDLGWLLAEASADADEQGGPPSLVAAEAAEAAEEPRVVRLTVEVAVHEPARLRAFAKCRYAACWADDGFQPEDLGEAAYEALIASNGTRAAPLGYGIELRDRHWIILGPDPDPTPPPHLPARPPQE